jgi:metal-responsive CopG/Arc/MetJ family transcriptional regulator
LILFCLAVDIYEDRDHYSYKDQHEEAFMRTVQMTLDDPLIQDVDRVARSLHTTRSAFTREALKQAVARVKMGRLEEKHRQGYLAHPAGSEEFSCWEKEQAWGDE